MIERAIRPEIMRNQAYRTVAHDTRDP